MMVTRLSYVVIVNESAGFKKYKKNFFRVQEFSRMKSRRLINLSVLNASKERRLKKSRYTLILLTSQINMATLFIIIGSVGICPQVVKVVS